ncbi:hypothetical protein M405DRAFT_935269 [Rhizopogon salebrosus TDB-379]|nr:hypothetical protein M405DRAFT_935269 [Rhizopogon salebrosus TDB-379]
MCITFLSTIPSCPIYIAALIEQPEVPNTTLAPYLQVLANGNSKKRQELEGLLAEMQVIIGQVRLEDASHLKPVIGQYVAPEPDIKSLEPPIFADTQRSHAKMGINHPQLAAMLCPVNFGRVQQGPPGKLQNGDIKMRAAVWSAFVYSGKIAGENFNPMQVQDGLLDGYLVMKHLFLGPSSALGAEGESVGTRPCNARLHNMTEVEAENIAYGVIQSRFAIASRDKWKEVDGNYNYRDAYYRIIDTIRCAPDASWAKKLHEALNLKLFKNKLGLHASSSMTTADDDEDDMALMKKQYEQRLANEATVTVATPPSAVHTEELQTPPKSPSYDDDPPVPDNIAPSAGCSEPHPPDKNITPPNSDPEPQDPLQGRPLRSNEPAPLFSNATDDHLSVLTDSDEEPQPPKAKFKKGHTRKAVESALPSPAPKRTRKARITRKKK